MCICEYCVTHNMCVRTVYIDEYVRELTLSLIWLYVYNTRNSIARDIGTPDIGI